MAQTNPPTTRRVHLRRIRLQAPRRIPRGFLPPHEAENHYRQTARKAEEQLRKERFDYANPIWSIYGRSYTRREVAEQVRRIMVESGELDPRRLATPSQRMAVFRRDAFKCQECGFVCKQNGKGLHADHIIAHSRGGQTEDDNLQTLCASCNLRKGARP